MATPIRRINGRRLMLCAPRRRSALAADVFAVLDADRVLQGRYQDRAVAGVPGLCRAGDHGDHLVHPTIRDDDVDLDPWAEIDGVFLPAVGLGVTSVAIG